jgi:hypothetical protein
MQNPTQLGIAIDILIETKDGRKINIVGDIDTFKSTLESFKEYLGKELPDFSNEEILKFDMQFHKLKKIYEWHNVHYLLAALEFELRKK